MTINRMRAAVVLATVAVFLMGADGGCQKRDKDPAVVAPAPPIGEGGVVDTDPYRVPTIEELERMWEAGGTEPAEPARRPVTKEDLAPEEKEVRLYVVTRPKRTTNIRWAATPPDRGEGPFQHLGDKWSKIVPVQTGDIVELTVTEVSRASTGYTICAIFVKVKGQYILTWNPSDTVSDPWMQRRDGRPCHVSLRVP